MSEAITEKKEVSSGGGRPAVIVSNDKNNAKSKIGRASCRERV